MRQIQNKITINANSVLKLYSVNGKIQCINDKDKKTNSIYTTRVDVLLIKELD